MNSIIEIKNLSFSYGKKKIFDSFSISISNGSWLTLYGENGSGKSTLVKIITGLLPYKGNIQLNGLPLNSTYLKQVRSFIGVVFENPNNQLIGETVMDAIAFGLENLQYDRSYILERIAEISKDLKIEDLLSRSIDVLSGGEKQLIALASVLVMNPRILILDEAFTMVDDFEKKKILKVLKRYYKSTGITIINVTHDIEESLYGDTIAIIQNGNLLCHDTKEKIFENEKIFRAASIDPPFLVSLYQKLKYYRLLEKPIYDMNEMVDALWK